MLLGLPLGGVLWLRRKGAGLGWLQGGRSATTSDSPHGRDPLGIKALGSTFSTDKSPLQHKFRKGSALSTENLDNRSFVKMLERSALNANNKTSSIIHESINETQTTDSDSGTMLDENQLLDE